MSQIEQTIKLRLDWLTLIWELPKVEQILSERMITSAQANMKTLDVLGQKQSLSELAKRELKESKRPWALELTPQIEQTA